VEQRAEGPHSVSVLCGGNSGKRTPGKEACEVLNRTVDLVAADCLKRIRRVKVAEDLGRRRTSR
jgi:hypothetical protein